MESIQQCNEGSAVNVCSGCQSLVCKDDVLCLLQGESLKIIYLVLASVDRSEETMCVVRSGGERWDGMD